MPERVHWAEDAERTNKDTRFLLGEDEDGGIYARSWTGDRWRQVNRWNPLHCLAYLGSRLRRELVGLERAE